MKRVVSSLSSQLKSNDAGGVTLRALGRGNGALLRTRRSSGTPLQCAVAGCTKRLEGTRPVSTSSVYAYPLLLQRPHGEVAGHARRGPELRRRLSTAAQQSARDAAEEAAGSGDAAREGESPSNGGEGDRESGDSGSSGAGGGDGSGGEYRESAAERLGNTVLGGALAAAIAFGGWKLYEIATFWPAPAAQMWDLVCWSPQVRAALGDSPSVGWGWDGAFKPDTMSVHIPVKGVGPEGKPVTGTVYGRAVLDDGQWHLLACAVVVDTDSLANAGLEGASGEAAGAAGVTGIIDVLEERMRAAGKLKPRVDPDKMAGHGVTIPIDEQRVEATKQRSGK